MVPQIEGFVLVDQLGQGTTATVWLARQTKLERLVALKIYEPAAAGTAGATNRRRFSREAKAIARLDHPHVVRLFRAVEADSGRYAVLEFVPGSSLAACLKHFAISVPLALHVLGQVASALTYAHSSGVIHRDVKPRNVLVSEHGLCKLTDFGTAKLTDEVLGPDGARLTRPGSLLGTASYMAPELIGDASSAGPQADLYSLACVTYELFAGHPPFGSGSGAFHALHAQLHARPIPLRELVVGFPPQVEEVVLRALSKEPHHRHPSVATYWCELDQAASLAWPTWRWFDCAAELHVMARTLAPSSREEGVPITETVQSSQDGRAPSETAGMLREAGGTLPKIGPTMPTSLFPPQSQWRKRRGRRRL